MSEQVLTLYDWRDIATCPKDGLDYLLGWDCTPHLRAFGYWNPEIEKWCDELLGNDFIIPPTHWFPLPRIPGKEAA